MSPTTIAAVLAALAAGTLPAHAPSEAGPLPSAQVAHRAPGASGTMQTPARTVAVAEQEFSMNLLRLSGPQGRNAVLSPWSAALSLSMLEGAAKGSTATGIAGALGDRGLASTSQAEGWKVLQSQISTAARAGHIQLNAANRLWVTRGFPVRPSYVQWLAKWYAADQGTFNGGDPAAAAAQINAWVDRQTKGQIKELLSAQALVDAVVVLANAVELKASWSEEFDPAKTEPAPFFPATGKAVSVPTMNQTDTTEPASTSPSLTAVQLPYRGGQLAALVLMPRKGTLAALEQSLAEKGFGQVLSTLHAERIRLALPRFTLQTAVNLNQGLTSLGMGQVFARSADLSGMSPTPSHVLLIRQVAKIQVDESGTKAAAATGTVIGATALSPEALSVVINHPFLLVVRDVHSGTILFAAQVNNPAAG